MPGLAPKMAVGLSLKGWSGGRDAQSIAFLSTPDIERLYSGVTIRSASAARMLSRNSCSGGGNPRCLTSSLYGWIGARSNVSMVMPAGASSIAARSAALLYEPWRRLPAKPKTLISSATRLLPTAAPPETGPATIADEIEQRPLLSEQ